MAESAAVDHLKPLYEAEKGRYADLQPVVHGEVSLNIDATGSPVAAATRQQVGFVVRGSDALFKAQINGFSYHKLPPYSDWESCRDEAKRLWERYRAITNPLRVNRLGLRYVNRLDLPAGGEIKDYLLTAPDIAPRLPQELSGYMMELTIAQPDIPGAVCVMRQGMIAPSRPDVASILLDIDVYQVVDLLGSAEEVWQLFEVLHARENEIFEGSITDRTRDIIS